MAGGYDKFLTKEDRFHMAVLTYLKLQFPQWKIVHCPNETYTASNFQKYKNKMLGTTAGVSDLLIFEPRCNEDRIYCGLCIELKVKPNKLTDSQKKFLDDLQPRGWSCHVAYDIVETMKIIQEYAALRPLKF